MSYGYDARAWVPRMSWHASHVGHTEHGNGMVAVEKSWFGSRKMHYDILHSSTQDLDKSLALRSRAPNNNPTSNVVLSCF
jgi:hypothetical protein